MAVTNSSLYLSRSVRLLSLFGLWPNSKFVILQKIWLAFNMLMFYTFLLSEFVYIIQVWGDFNEVSDASYLVVTQASLCIKAAAFIIDSKNLIELLEYMDCEDFQAKCNDHEKILVNQATKIKRLCLFNLLSVTSTCSLWTVLPLFGSGERTFPYKIWMPVTTEKSPHYELGYIFQALALYISAVNFVGIDSVVVTMLMFACAQLEIIMDKINKVQNVSYGEKSKREINGLIKNNYEVLVECIKQHQLLEKFIQLVADTFHANTFFQLSGTVVIMCNIGLRITMVDHRGSQFSMLNYLMSMILQLFLYCWFGNQLTTASEDIREYLYQCPWHEQDIKFKRALLITMERMKQPIVFKAGHYIPLSRPTFITILRCSYSYFTILNRVNN